MHLQYFYLCFLLNSGFRFIYRDFSFIYFHSSCPYFSMVPRMHLESPRFAQVKIFSERMIVFAVEPESRQSKSWFFKFVFVPLKAVLIMWFLTLFWIFVKTSCSLIGLSFSSSGLILIATGTDLSEPSFSLLGLKALEASSSRVATSSFLIYPLTFSPSSPWPS